MKVMKITLTLWVLLAVSVAQGQSKVETAFNFRVRAADAAQTCYHLANTPRWHEDWLPTQSCGGVVGISAGWAVGAFTLDRFLIRRGHSRFAHFQTLSGASAGVGITYTFTH